MTKKDAKAAEVLANRRIAFEKKVRSLTGHVLGRIPHSEVMAAFDADQTADAYAALIASREPVGMALHTQKADAVREAETVARATVARVEAEMVKYGWDLNAAAPYPKYNEPQYSAAVKKGRYQLFQSLTESVGSGYYSSRSNEPRIVIMSVKGIERFVQHAREDAAAQYDMFICKMVSKTGDQVAFATIEGSHVWSHSILTVELKDGTVQKWKTQQIWNTSVLGKSFPQWPSRIVK